MGFFSRKTKDSRDQSIHFVNVIKNESQVKDLIWKHWCEDFNTNSTLIVMPGEKAIFVDKGRIEGVFDPGTYKLDTENYPFIRRLRSAFSGKVSAFHCVVYYVNTTVRVNFKWGVPGKFQVIDPVYNLPLSLHAHGSYSATVDDPALFMEKMFGQGGTLDHADLHDYINPMVAQYVTSEIGEFIRFSGQEIIGICADQTAISESVQEKISEFFEEIGMRLLHFYTEIVLNESDDLYQRLMRVRGEKLERDILGPSSKEEQTGSGQDENTEALKKLKNLLDQGLITKEVYDKKMAEIVEKMIF